jgi:hypothetical protein
VTAQEAMDTIVRESAEAGVQMAPAGQDPEVRAALVELMEGKPFAIEGFVRRSREYIAMLRAT